MSGFLSEIFKMKEESQICKFYDGQTVLITGGTGFMGKILVEKLLRSTDVATIYVLIREKKGQDIHSRLDMLFDNIIFDRLKTERPKFRHRVVAVSGDCHTTGLGLTITDRQKLLSDVSVVYHVAATVRFDENLKIAYAINVKGTSDVIELCRQMKGLKSLVHVSTAYSNCYRDSIEEKFYDYQVDYDKVGAMLEKMSEAEADKLTPRIIDSWPNTYTFTKALAESLIRNTAHTLPIGIFRPSIVISTCREPIELWTDNLGGPAAPITGVASGLLRVFPCDEDTVADLVPVDTCVAGIVAAAWDVANRRTERSVANIPIYNYVSSVENAITWGEYNALNIVHGRRYPSLKALWTMTLTSIVNRPLYLLLRVLLHLVPAFLLDAVAVLSGQKPEMVSIYHKLHKYSDAVSFFCTRQWKFRNDNVVALWEKMNRTDQILFPFSVTTVHWITYFKGYFRGIRIYLMKDPISTLDQAKIRMRNFGILRHCLIWLWNFLLVTFIWGLILTVGSPITTSISTPPSLNTTEQFFTHS